MNKELEIVKSNTSLGRYFSSNGNFKGSGIHLADQAKKAMYLLYKRISTVFILGFEKMWGICPRALKKCGGFSKSVGDYKVMK